MSIEYKQYKRSQIAELADWVPGFDMAGVSVSDADKQAGSPKSGDKIARNPANHADRWLVAADYFAANFEPIDAALKAAQPQEYPSSADDEATRWRHGEPIGEVLSVQENKVVPNETFTVIVPHGKTAPPIGTKVFMQPERMSVPIYATEHIGKCGKPCGELEIGNRGCGYPDCMPKQPERVSVPTGWQPIKSVPKDGREVLLRVEMRAGIPGGMLVGHYMPGGHCIEDHPPIDEGWYFWDGSRFDKASKPTHWMPLPAAQEGK